MKWTFKKYKHFGFFIPDNRDHFWGDFFVNKHNDRNAQEWQRVIARELSKSAGKKPEAKIVEIIWEKKQNTYNKKTISWIYLETNAEFGFIEIPDSEKSCFVHASKRNWAKHWDMVEAEIASYNGKEEWIITNIKEVQNELTVWELKDNWDFGFVYTKKWQDDIFISASNYNWAQSGDTVKVQVTKTWGRRPEWVVLSIETVH